MVQLNAAARLVATATGVTADEGIADKAHAEQQIKSGRYKVVEGEGQRWLAVKFPNGRFGVLDMGVTGQASPMRAAGLDEKTARKAVNEANRTGKYHPALTMTGAASTINAALSDGLNPKQKDRAEDILSNWEDSDDEEVLKALIVDLKIPRATAEKLVAMRDKFMNFMPTKAKPRLEW